MIKNWYFSSLYSISKHFLLLALLFILPDVTVSSEIVITISNKYAQTEVRSGKKKLLFKPYIVSVNDQNYSTELPHSIPLNKLIRNTNDQEEVEVSFRLVGFEEETIEVTPRGSFHYLMTNLLINNPESYISDQRLLDNINPKTKLSYREMGVAFVKPTCFQLFIYFETGENRQDRLDCKYTESEVIVDKDLRAGRWALLKRGDVAIHFMLSLSHGIYMSKVGNYGIFFHTLESVLDIYGHDLTLHRVWCNDYERQSSNSNKFDRDPPAPGAGACGGASTSAY